MAPLTLTQEYLICTIDKKGSLPSYSQETAACLIISGLLEMEAESCISVVGKKIAVRGKLPENLSVLAPLYHTLRKKRPTKLQKILDRYLLSCSRKRLRALSASIMAPLREENLAVSVFSGLIKKREQFAPTKEAQEQVIQKIRQELLENATLTENTAALALLLNKAGCLKHYFSKQERKELKIRLEEIKNGDGDKRIKDWLNQTETMLTLLYIVSGL